MSVDLTAEEVRALLWYDPETGVFRKRKADRIGPLVGFLDDSGYVEIVIKGRKQRAHRLAWAYVYSEWPRAIDHINMEKDDNRIVNLREASTSQNLCNRGRPRSNTSGIKGAWRRRNGRFEVRIGAGRKKHYIGTFRTAKEAREAYHKAAVKLHGDFARTE